MTADPDGHLPAVPDDDRTLIPLRRVVPGLGRDFLRTAVQTDNAVRAVSGDSDDSHSAVADCELMVWAGWLTRGDTQIAALRQLLQLMESSPGTQVTMLSLNRVPGPAVGTWEWAVCAATDTPDPETGESSSPVHHTDRKGRVTRD